MIKDPRKLVVELAQKVGKHDAQRLLVDEGVSTSTAQKLVGARYHSEVKELTRQAIMRAFDAARRQKLIA